MKNNSFKRMAGVFLLLVIPAMIFAANPWRQARTIEKAIVAPSFPNRTFLITDYFRQGDTIYTEAINKAIVACAAQGGGRVVVPKGVFKTAAIHLRSNVDLHLEEGAVLQFSTNRDLYPIVLTRIEGIDCYNLSPLIYAYGETNIAVTGKGLLDGQATFDNWLHPDWLWKITMPDGKEGKEKDLLNKALEQQWPIEKRVFEGKYGMRPRFINFY